MTNTTAINKQIPSERWLEFFDTFSDGNRGRQLTIELISQEFGDQELIKDAPFWAAIYDPAGKGNDLVIETGQNQVAYAHTIDKPTEVWLGQDENGVVQVVKITNAAGDNTLMCFK